MCVSLVIQSRLSDVADNAMIDASAETLTERAVLLRLKCVITSLKLPPEHAATTDFSHRNTGGLAW